MQTSGPLWLISFPTPEAKAVIDKTSEQTKQSVSVEPILIFEGCVESEMHLHKHLFKCNYLIQGSSWKVWPKQKNQIIQGKSSPRYRG